MVGEGDILQITHPSGNYRILILAIPQRRGPAPEALGCYRQIEFTARSRSKASVAQSGMHPAPDRRPDKKSRRSLRELKRKL